MKAKDSSQTQNNDRLTSARKAKSPVHTSKVTEKLSRPPFLAFARKQRGWTAVAKRALAFFLPMVLLMVGIAAVVYFVWSRPQRIVLEINEKQTVDLHKKYIAADIESVNTHLVFISKGMNLDELLQSKGLSNMDTYASNRRIEAKNALGEEFLRLSASCRMYDQIRYLNENGMETVRVNFNEGEPSIVPDDKLQNKAKRYYFADAFVLEKGQVFVSPLDLNIERGRIERPLDSRLRPGTKPFDNIWLPAGDKKYVKPMLHFATPVFNRQGGKRGIVLLNYFGANLLNRLSEIRGTEKSQLMLLNADGYWLKGPNPQDEFGFMYEDRKDRTFANAYPDAWQQILSEDSGQFQTTVGLFTFATVYPLLAGQQSSTGSSQAFAPSQSKLRTDQYYWKIVSYLPGTAFASENIASSGMNIALLVVFAAIMGIGSWQMTASSKTKIAQKLWLSFMLLIAVLALSGFVSYHLIQRINKDVVQIARVEEPLKEAVLEMEINAAETTRAGLDYLRHRDPEDIEQIYDSEADFMRFAAEFNRLAETRQAKQLGRQAAKLYTEFKKLGDDIITLVDKQYEHLQSFRKIVEETDELIDKKIPKNINRTTPNKMQALFGIKGIIDETAPAIESYALQPKPSLRQKLLGAKADFEQFVAMYRRTHLTGDEKRWLDQIEKDFTEVVKAGNNIITLTDDLHNAFENFEDNFEQIEALLDDHIQPLIHAETVCVEADARRSGTTALIATFAMAVLALTVLGATNWLISRHITASVSKLAEAARNVKQGNFDYRINVKTKDELGQLAVAFNQMAEQRKQANEALQKAHDELEERVRQRTAELQETHDKFIEIARKTGMAEVATGVLHNVGNVLTSVSITTESIQKSVQDSKVSYLTDVVNLLEEHTDNLGEFMTNEERGRKLPAFLANLSNELIAEQERSLEALQTLTKHVEHIAEIIHLQQSYSKMTSTVDSVSAAEVIEDAIRINAEALNRHDVEIKREFADLPLVLLDCHKVLQILTNLIRNAKYALSDSGRDDKILTIRITEPQDGHFRIEVHDNGTGITKENLSHIFEHGFTTKKRGYGFGLHSGALAAKEINGSLTGHSDGPGNGAVFTLELPFQTQEAQKNE